MSRHHTNYDIFLAEMAKQGTGAYEASQLPEAQRAHFLDEQLDEHETRTRKDWPTVHDHFQSTEEFRAAMSDPAYKVNPHYRNKVHDMLRKSAPHIGSENVVEPGTNALDTVTNESMIETARLDALRDQTKKAFKEAERDPLKKWKLYESLGDEVNREVVEGAEHAFSGEGPLQRAFRLSKGGSFGSDLNKAMANEEEDNGSSGPSQSAGGQVTA